MFIAAREGSFVAFDNPEDAERTAHKCMTVRPHVNAMKIYRLVEVGTVTHPTKPTRKRAAQPRPVA